MGMMLEGRQIAAAIFDMDGLMINTEKLALDGYYQVTQEMGYHMPREAIVATAGRNVHDTRKAFQDVLGPDVPFDEIRARRFVYADGFIEKNGVPIKPGLHRLLDALEAHAIRKAVATSTEEYKAIELLTKAGILERFELMVFGDQVPRGKPEPDIFLEAARRLQLEPAQCLVFEDSAAGIKCAANAGMLSVMVPDLLPPSKETKALATRIFQSLGEAADTLF